MLKLDVMEVEVINNGIGYGNELLKEGDDSSTKPVKNSLAICLDVENAYQCHCVVNDC